MFEELFLDAVRLTTTNIVSGSVQGRSPPQRAPVWQGIQPMKTLSVTLLLTTVLIGTPMATAADKWDAQWKKVDDAVQKGLPQTAIEQLQPILTGATAEKNYPVAIKAIARKIALEGTIQGNKPEEKIIRMDAEIAKAPAEMQPMLEVVQADWYWQYFLHNRWRFMQRTATEAAPGKDFTTWDLPRLFAEIDKHFQKALAAEEQLKKIPIASFDGLLDKGTMPDSYRPTLYDFVAHQALEFYNAGEQAGAKAEDAFDLSADSPIFRPMEEFVAWKIESTDSDSVTLKAIRLYQQLLSFHQKDGDKAALLDADLERLSFGNNKAVGEEKATLYKAALQRFVKQWGDHPISAIARYRWAEVLQQEGSLVEAHDLAQQGAQAFPNEPGGKLCYNLMKQIEAKSANIVTERVWNEPSPSIRVTYRNLTTVYFRLIRQDWVARLKKTPYRGENLDDAQRKAILAQKPDVTWSANLPPTERLPGAGRRPSGAEGPEAGLLLSLGQLRPDFQRGEQHRLVHGRLGEQAGPGAPAAEHGRPVRRLRARCRLGRADRRGRRAGLRLGLERRRRYHGTQDADRPQRPVRRRRHRQPEQSALRHPRRPGTGSQWQPLSKFRRLPADSAKGSRSSSPTARSIGPGQTIHYKGIAILVDQEADNYKVLPKQRVTVVFSDANGKEIARQTPVANDYGSFSGSFTAPRDRLMGRMMIHVTTAICRAIPGSTSRSTSGPSSR